MGANSPMKMLMMSILAVGAAAVYGQTNAPVPAKPCESHAILVGSLPGSPLYARRFEDWMTRFHAYLLKAGVPARNILVLCGDKTFKSPIVNGSATTESVCKAITDIGGRCAEKDQFILILIGHGSVADMMPSFLLPGPDLTAEDLAKAMAAVTAGTQVVLNFSGSGGSMLKAMTAKGRINIAATSPEEPSEPVLAEFFLKALETGAADGEGAPGKAKDGVVSLLEALNGSSYQTALFISRQRANPEDGTWDVTGKESVALFKKLYSGTGTEEGVRAIAAGSDASAADAVVEIVPPTEAGAARAWGGRRLVDEHATLEDAGLESGLTPLTTKGYVPIVPAKPDSEGALAAKTILGRCQPLEK